MGILYDVLFFLILLAFLPVYFLKRKFHPGFSARFGRLPNGAQFNHPIWIHAVSVGEAVSIKKLVEELRQIYPGRQFLFTTVTPTGNAVISKIAAAGDVVTYLPFDFSSVVRKFIRTVAPSLCILAETELWPNLINCLARERIPIVVVNARISDSSLRGYSLIKCLAKSVFNKVHTFCAQSERDSQRLSALGVAAHKLQVTGNMKFDLDSTPQALSAAHEIREHAGDTGIVWVAASTHPGENEMVMRVYKKLLPSFPGVKLLIAPRHPQRSSQIAAIAERFGFPSLFISQLERLPATRHLQPIFILDIIGQLIPFYSIADIVFVGGSLVKRGGHNILEPAALGKPVFFGPHMFNFRDIADLFVENEAGVMVRNEQELGQKIQYYLGHTSQLQDMTRRARALLEANQGATAKTKRIIMEVFPLR
jgi:3-deoxy-D-manno-octulosonic-acid transferase